MDNRFFIVVACRNASKTIRRCTDSIQTQKFKNIRCIIIDDASEDDTASIARLSLSNDKRFTVFRNRHRQYALRNIVEAIWSHAAQEDIVLTVDGDDSLSDPDALQAISDEYKRTDSDAIWTQYETQDGSPCICGSMRGKHSDFLNCPWSMSHARTFRKYLIQGINPRVFIDPHDGQWWKYSYDQILYRPILYMASRPNFFPRVCYSYTVPSETKEYKDIQLDCATRFLRRVMKDYISPKKTTFIVNGPTGQSDKRFFYGEKRPPLGILSMSSHLRQRHHHVTIIDRFSFKNADYLSSAREADLVGVSLTTPNKEDGKDIIKTIRHNFPSKYIVAGGPHAILYPKSVLSAGANCACIGEADFTISDILINQPTGIFDCGRIENLDSVPIPDFDQVWGKKYDWTWTYSKRTPVFPYASSRGCPHFCSFCQTRDIWGRAYHAQTAERLFNDIVFIQSRYDLGGIYFREDNFGYDSKRVRKFCQLMIDNGTELQWACEIRADRAQEPGLLEIMARAGCIGIYVGVEGGSDRMLLDVFHKGISKEDIFACASLAKKNKIQRTFSFIEKHPLETNTDIDEREELIARINPEVVHRCEFRAKGMEEGEG